MNKAKEIHEAWPWSFPNIVSRGYSNKFAARFIHGWSYELPALSNILVDENLSAVIKAALTIIGKTSGQLERLSYDKAAELFVTHGEKLNAMWQKIHREEATVEEAWLL